MKDCDRDSCVPVPGASCGNLDEASGDARPSSKKPCRLEPLLWLGAFVMSENVAKLIGHTGCIETLSGRGRRQLLAGASIVSTAMQPTRRGSNMTICFGWRVQMNTACEQGKRCFPDNTVEVTGLCSSPLPPAFCHYRLTGYPFNRSNLEGWRLRRLV